MNSSRLVLNGISEQFESFIQKPNRPPTCPLRPIKMNNTWPSCITAAAGTELAGPFFKPHFKNRYFRVAGIYDTILLLPYN